MPNTPNPSDNARNTVTVNNYLIDFQSGWYLVANDETAPVRYRNGMMEPTAIRSTFRPNDTPT